MTVEAVYRVVRPAAEDGAGQPALIVETGHDGVQPAQGDGDGPLCIVGGGNSGLEDSQAAAIKLPAECGRSSYTVAGESVVRGQSCVFDPGIQVDGENGLPAVDDDQQDDGMVDTG